LLTVKVKYTDGD